MSLELMKKWVSLLPPTERNLPLLHVGNVFYTPEQALREVERGTSIGEKLQQLVEEGRFGTDVQALVKARLQLVLKQAAEEGYKIATLSGAVYTPQQLIEILEKGELNSNPALKLLAEADLDLAKRALQLGKKLAGGE